MAIKMTVAIARAAGQDLANKRMRKAGRKAWNRADYNAAIKEMNRVLELAGLPTERTINTFLAQG